MENKKVIYFIAVMMFFLLGAHNVLAITDDEFCKNLGYNGGCYCGITAADCNYCSGDPCSIGADADCNTYYYNTTGIHAVCCYSYKSTGSSCTSAKTCSLTASGNFSCYYTQCDGSGSCSNGWTYDWCCNNKKDLGCSGGICGTGTGTCRKGYCNAECAVSSDCPSGQECQADCTCGVVPTECDGTCNGICHSSCTGVDEDPDCGCQDNDGCCGIGCTSANDNDCVGVCSSYTSSSQCGGAGCCWCDYPAPVHCQDCPCEELPPPAGEGQAVCTGQYCPDGSDCGWRECVSNCACSYYKNGIKYICSCFNSCPAGHCCCWGSYNCPWCCNDAGYAKPSNCGCPPPYCCPTSYPVLCAGSCYPAGTQCSCNGSPPACPSSCCSKGGNVIKNVTNNWPSGWYYACADNAACGCEAYAGLDCFEWCDWGCENGVCKSPPPCYGWGNGTQPTACSGNNYCCGGECVTKPASCVECQYIGLCCSGSSAVCCNEPTTTICGTKDCDYLDTTCRDYYDVTKYCNGSGACPPASCDSYTNAAASVECGIKTIPCPGGGEAFCTQYCDGNGNCIDCTPLCNQIPTADSLSREVGCIWPLVALTLEFVDLDAGDGMSGYQVEIWDHSDFTGTKLLDSTKIATIPADYPTGTTFTYEVGELPISSTAVYYWRVKVWDSSDAESIWADGGDTGIKLL